MKRRMGLKKTLLLALFGVGLLPLAGISILSHEMASRALVGKTLASAESIRDLKRFQLENLFADFDNQLAILSANPIVIQALHDLTGAIQGGAAVGSAAWADAAEPYANALKVINTRNGWYDIFLISAEGQIVYTVAREADLGERMDGKMLTDSALAQAYAAAKQAKDGKVGAADFRPYAPSNGEPASFRVIPVSGVDGSPLGYLAMQLPADKINSIMTRQDGLGTRGETYLLGPDGRMRSDSVLDPASHSVAASFKKEAGHVSTASTKAALAGGTGAMRGSDYRGEPVISAYAPFPAPGGGVWALVAEIDESEALSALFSLRYRLLGAFGLVAVLVLVTALILARRIERPILHAVIELNGAAKQVSQASDEVSGSAQKVAEGASEQAAAIEEISASAEELMSMINAGEEVNNNAHESMGRSRVAVETTSGEMNTLLKTINELSATARRPGRSSRRSTRSHSRRTSSP